MRNLLRNLGKIVGDGITASSNEIIRAFNDFDFNDTKHQLNEMTQRLGNDVKRLLNHIHNYMDKWEVDIDFNMDEDVITYNIVDNTLEITVKKDTETDTESVRTFSTHIPDDVDIETLTQSYNRELHKAIFTFKKKN